MKEKILEILKAIVAVILAIIVFFLAMAITASIRLEREIVKAETGGVQK